MIPSLLRKLIRFANTPASATTRGRQLQLQGLEDRLVPSTLTVDDDRMQNPRAQFTTISEALAAARPGSTIRVFDGTYTESLSINKAGIRLTAQGTNVHLRSPADLTPLTLEGTVLGAALVDIAASRVTVQGFQLAGSTNTDGDLYAGIRVLRDGSATIRNNTIRGMITTTDENFGVGIQVGSGRISATAGAGTALIKDNTIDTYLGAGILVDGSRALATIESNTITGRGVDNNFITHYGIQVSRGAAGRIEDNSIFNNTGDFSSAGILFFQTNADNWAIDNFVSGNDTGIWVYEATPAISQQMRINKNVITGNVGFAGIQVTISDNVEVKNNEIFDNTTSNGIAVGSSTNVQVKKNTIFDNEYADGIYLFEGGFHEVTHNEVFNNGFNGIFLEDSSNNELRQNEVFDNLEHGIYLSGGSNNLIRSNESHHNGQSGLFVDSSFATDIFQNEFTWNNWYGIHLLNAENTIMRPNTVSNNVLGQILIIGGSTLTP